MNTQQHNEPGVVAKHSAAHASSWKQPGVTAGLQPAFRDQRTGETHLSLTDDGEPATVHSFTRLPAAWIVERDRRGRALALHPAIVAGYWRGAGFIALTRVLELPLDA